MQEINMECNDHTVSIDCRKQISVTGVIDVISFDESNILLSTNGGKMLIEGENIQISVLDVGTGKLSAVGKIDAVSYSDREQDERRGFFSRLVK